MLNLLPLHSREATSQAHRLCCCQWTFKQRSKFHWMSKLQIHSAFNKEISVQRVSELEKHSPLWILMKENALSLCNFQKMTTIHLAVGQQCKMHQFTANAQHSFKRKGRRTCGGNEFH